MKDINCDVVKDLITLYVDDLTSEKSSKLVEEHIKECSECREYLEVIREKEFNKMDIEVWVPENVEEELLNKIKKGIFKSKLLFIILGVIIGVVFSIGPNIFRGILIIPALGGLTYLLTRKVYIAPAIVFITITIATIIEIALGGGSYGAIELIYSSAVMGAMYTFFCIIGVVIGYLIVKIFLED